MTYKQDMVEVFGFILFVSYGIGIIVGLIVGGVLILLFSYGHLCCETYWYIGIPMIIGGIFLIPTIEKVCDITLGWVEK